MKARFAVLLWLALVVLLVADGAEFFFRRPFYEWWDSAANALSIDRAKHFSQLYGAYSRWGFCHPGPALFYLQALGEWLFYDRLHLSPAPFNAQTLFYACFATGLFVLILRTFTHWMPARAWRLFLPAAVALSALHFIAMGRLTTYDVLLGPTALAGVWPVHVVVLPFAGLLIAGASVSAGRARDLPLLLFCGGFLLHLHVSQPLLVVPVVTLSYLGLVRSTTPRVAADTGARRWLGRLGALWRTHWRVHLLGCAIIALTALPVLIDLRKGPDSNLALILDHLHNYRGEHKSLVRSLLYFLQFGAYTPFIPYTADHLDDMQFGHFDYGSAMAYVRAHAGAYALWLGGVALPVVAAARRRPAADAAPDDAAAGSRRFFGRFVGLLVTVIGLTLYWGTIQDGRMYYYNAWFNFGIYGAVGLAALAAAILLLPPVGRPAAGAAWWPPVAAWAAALALCASLAGPLRVRAADPEINEAMHAGILRAVAAYAPPDTRATTRILRFGSWYWDGAIAVALQLQRDGTRFVVPDQWGVVFGQENTWKASLRDHSPRPAERWFIDAQPILDPGLAAVSFPILHNVSKLSETITVSKDLPVLDPAGDARESSILFRKGGNSLEFMVGGWAGEELWGRWTDTDTCELTFRPAPCGSEGVALTLDAVPFVMPQRGLERQRVQFLFNGQPLGGEQVFAGEGDPVTVHVPAEMWNGAASAGDPRVVLEMKLRDAASPHSVDPANPDLRILALHFAALRVAPWSRSASVGPAQGARYAPSQDR